MKKVIITLLVLLGIAAVGVVSCPDKEAHKDAIMAVVKETINEEMKSEDDGLQGLGVLFGSIGSSVAGYFIDNRLTVKNYYVYSVGKLKNLEGEDNTVSVGIFGHIFTVKKEDLKKALE